MTKELNLKRTEEKQKVEENVRLSELSTLLVASLTVFAVLYGFLKQIVQPEQFTSSILFGVVPLVIVGIKILMVIFGLYIMALITLSFIRIYDPQNKKKEGIFTLRKMLIKITYDAPFSLDIMIGSTFGLFLTTFLTVMLRDIFFWISFVVLWLFVVSLILMKAVEGKFWKILIYALGVLVTVIVVYLIVNLTLLFTSNVTVILDKDHYFHGDNVYAKIYASGLLNEPELKAVYYSPPGVGLLLVNRTEDFAYKSAPILVKVNSSNLTSDTRASYLLVVYNYGVAFILPKPNPHVKIEFVPVFEYNNST